MKINTFGEFYTFLQKNNFVNLDTAIADFCACVSQYNVLCACKKQSKINKGEICNDQYINIVNNVLPRYKDQLLDQLNMATITFAYNNNFIIGSISR